MLIPSNFIDAMFSLLSLLFPSTGTEWCPKSVERFVVKWWWCWWFTCGVFNWFLIVLNTIEIIAVDFLMRWWWWDDENNLTLLNNIIVKSKSSKPNGTNLKTQVRTPQITIKPLVKLHNFKPIQNIQSMPTFFSEVVVLMNDNTDMKELVINILKKARLNNKQLTLKQIIKNIKK